MKRRDFLSGAGAVFAAKAAGQNVRPSISPDPLLPKRSSRAFDVHAAAGADSAEAKREVQRVFSDGVELFCLYCTRQERGISYAVAASTSIGDISWNYDLPLGVYTSLGQAGQAIWLWAGFRAGEANGSLLMLDPRRRALSAVVSANSAPGFGEPGLRWPAGDSKILQCATSGVSRLWTLTQTSVHTQWDSNFSGVSS